MQEAETHPRRVQVGGRSASPVVRGRPGLGAAAGRAGLAEASWGGGAAPPRAEASTRKDSASAPKIQSE